MYILQISVAAVLVLIAMVHLVWATGNHFPARSERDLVALAVGFRGHTKMPGAVPCIVVAMALLTIAGMLLLASGTPRTAFLVAAASVFVLRGLAAYTPAWRRLTPQQPFATLDRFLFGPLCLFLGAALIMLS